MKSLKYTIAALLILFSVSTVQAQKSDNYVKKGDKILVTRYHDNGSPRETGEYVNGVAHGEWAWYDEEGNVIREAYYKNGKKEGKWFVWSDDGKFLYELKYENNLLVNSHRWKIEERNMLAGE